MISFAQTTSGKLLSADNFIPLLIYVLLQTNPPSLASNINYIETYVNPIILNTEHGYYFHAVVGAISFIETLDASVLSIDPLEFDRLYSPSPFSGRGKCENVE